MIFVLVKVWSDTHEPGVETAIAGTPETACKALMELAYHPDEEEPEVEYQKLEEALQSDPQGLALHLSKKQANDGRSFYVEEHAIGPLAISVEGGLIQDVVSDSDALRQLPVFVIDYDIDGADEEELTVVSDGMPGAIRAYVSRRGVENAAIDLEELVRKFEEGLEK